MHVPFCDPNRLRPTCNFSQASRFISSRKSLHPAVGCVFLSVFSPRSVKPHSLISYVRESPLLRALPVIPFPQPQALFQGSNPVAEFDLHRAVVCHYSRASKAISRQQIWMAESISKSISSAEAVVLGALASGVNGPTWVVLKITFMMLAICLIAMLSLAFVSSEFIIVGHIVLLVIIGSVLFVLLNSFLAQTGLVSVEQQIEEMGISKNDKQN